MDIGRSLGRPKVQQGQRSLLLLVPAVMLLAGAFFALGLLGCGDAGKTPDVSSSHPRLEAHRLLDQKTPAAIVYEWIPYYYRHPRPQETVEIIGKVLPQIVDVDPVQMRGLCHFFAAILQGQQAELDKLKAASRQFSRKQAETLGAIIKATEDYRPVKEVSAESLEPLWWEYRATGNKEIIARLIQALAAANSSHDVALEEAVRGSFLRHLPAHLEALRAFDDTLLKAPDDLAALLKEIRMKEHETYSEPAKMHLVRAENHVKQREYSQALDEWEKALTYCPDYQNVFINLANMYEAQGKLKESLAAMEKAAQTDPASASAAYGLGRHYSRQGRNEEAIKWYAKALEHNPRSPLYNHAMARSYQDRGDVPNAVKYFQEYLKYAPNGEYGEVVRRYLASVNNPGAMGDSIFMAFKKKDYESLERQLATLLKEKKKDKDGRSLLANAYGQICDSPDAKYVMETWLREFEEWLHAKPDSHFANTAMGRFCVNYAWHARGSGWANTVTSQGWNLFNERLVKAREYLEKGYQADPSDPMAPSQLIVVAMGLGEGYPEVEKQFQRALKADRSDINAYEAKLKYLMPKWHGSREQMFAFAREAARKGPADSLAPLVLAKAHWEMYARSEDKRSYFRDPEVWQEVKVVYRSLCRRFPESLERHNWFMRTAYLAGDFETARRELAIIKDNWSEQVWSQAGFLKAREEILRR